MCAIKCKCVRSLKSNQNFESKVVCAQASTYLVDETIGNNKPEPEPEALRKNITFLVSLLP